MSTGFHLNWKYECEIVNIAAGQFQTATKSKLKTAFISTDVESISLILKVKMDNCFMYP